MLLEDLSTGHTVNQGYHKVEARLLYLEELPESLDDVYSLFGDYREKSKAHLKNYTRLIMILRDKEPTNYVELLNHQNGLSSGCQES